jgi:hypothetical protein
MSKVEPEKNLNKRMSRPKGISMDDSWAIDEGRPSRKQQRISKVTSKFFRNSLTAYKDDNDSFRIPAHQVDAIARNLERKEKKIAQLWYALVIALLFAVGTFSLTLASGYLANEQSKESHVRGKTMEDLDGNPVSTGDLESFSSLFDLPHYDAYTLSKITHLSVKLSEETQGSFEIASVLKSKVGCAESVTLFTSEGNQIVVDSITGMAAVYVGNDQYVIQAGDLESERRSLYKSKEATPRLYSRTEFFFPQSTSTSHRQLNSQTSSGWATFGTLLSDISFISHTTRSYI